MKYNREILNRFLTEKVAINVETEQEWDDFMELLESETDCKWSRVKLPTDVGEWTHSKEDKAVVLNYFGNNGLGYSSCDFYQNNGYEVIKYKDLVKGEETMTNIEKVNKALENADESKIKEVLDFLGHKEDEKFIPKYGEEYYFVGTFGDIDYPDGADVELVSELDTKHEDPVNSPSHYTQYSTINGEVLDLIEEVTIHYPKEVAYHIGNALKYLLRAPFKNNMVQDLKKCAFHVNRAIGLLDGDKDEY